MEWPSVLNNRKDYPDDMKVSMGGQEVTLKELRDTLIPKGEFTKVTQQAAQEKSALEGQLRDATQQLAIALQRSGQAPAQTQDRLADLAQDPTFGPLVQEVYQARRVLGEIANRQQQYELNQWTNQHLAALKEITTKDKDLNAQALVEFARTRGLTNLHDAYALQTRERDIDSARKEAEAKGYEKGKKEASIPVIPTGRRTAPPGQSLPETLDAAAEAAKSDPDVLAAMAGLGG